MAGLAAADLLARHGLQVLVVDENGHTGGQLLRRMPHAPARTQGFEPSLMKRRGSRLLARVRARRDITIMQRSQVVGIFSENHLLIEDDSGRMAEMQAPFIICATGARERLLPFKGWTLPGVMATGAAQILIKGSGVLPGAELLIAGSGPLPLVLTSQILSHKSRVRAILDQSARRDKAGIWLLAHQWPRLLEGAWHLSRILAARTPLRHNTRVIEARGRGRLEAVVAAQFDARGRIVPGSELIYRADALAIGGGFVPNIELLQQAGCTTHFDPDKGGWAAAVDEQMITSVETIYAAGETTGIAGAEKSYLEGQIAAWSILHRLGLAAHREFAATQARLSRQRQRQLRYGRFLNRLCRVPPRYYDFLADDTVICRCEEVTLGTIRHALADGFSTMGALKKATRCGMGNCQGRICGPLLHDILAATGRKFDAQIGPLSIRSPVKPVRLGALAATGAQT